MTLKNKTLQVDTTQAEVDMTRPQPCMQWAEHTMAWMDKLFEEIDEVLDEWELLVCKSIQNDERLRKEREDKLAEELTDVITVCTSWLNGLGYNEEDRKELQRKVNEKNKVLGYW